MQLTVQEKKDEKKIKHKRAQSREIMPAVSDVVKFSRSTLAIKKTQQMHHLQQQFLGGAANEQD